MKVALIGATGNAGSRILEELLNRGHEVTGIARHPEKLEARDNLTVKTGDANDEAALASLISGHDAAISTTKFVSTNPRSVIDAAKQSGTRLLVAGGAGSLEATPGHRLIDSPNFPEAYKAEAMAGAEFLDILRTEEVLEWTYLSPSMLFVPANAPENSVSEMDELLVAENDESKISFEDYAIALVDELEKPQHTGRRFTVGY